MLNNIFAKKPTEITLSKALELKENIEEKIKSCYGTLKRENNIPKKQRNYNLKKIVKEGIELQQQLVQLKMIIQRANLFVPEGEEFCISHYVYLLSEKKAAMLVLQSMIKNWSNETEKEVNIPVYSLNEIEDWINTLKKESNVIKDKLTALNSTITVEIPFKTKLL